MKSHWHWRIWNENSFRVVEAHSRWYARTHHSFFVLLLSTTVLLHLNLCLQYLHLKQQCRAETSEHCHRVAWDRMLRRVSSQSSIHTSDTLSYIWYFFMHPTLIHTSDNNSYIRYWFTHPILFHTSDSDCWRQQQWNENDSVYSYLSQIPRFWDLHGNVLLIGPPQHLLLGVGAG